MIRTGSPALRAGALFNWATQIIRWVKQECFLLFDHVYVRTVISRMEVNTYLVLGKVREKIKIRNHDSQTGGLNTKFSLQISLYVY